MIAANQFMQQPGGLNTAVWACDQSDLSQLAALERILRDTIRHEAKVHGAEFDPIAFRNVMCAMQSGDVEILFLAAAWDLSKPKIVGATINFRSLFLQDPKLDVAANDGIFELAANDPVYNKTYVSAKYGIYSEDVCLLPSMIRELVSERPEGFSFPDEGIGTHFIRKCMSYFSKHGMKGGIIPAGQRFEFIPENKKIVNIQEELGAVLGQKTTSGLFRLNEIPASIKNRWRLPVEILKVPYVGGEIDPNNFVVSWSDYDRQQKIIYGASRCLSTFNGWSVTQGQLLGNGKSPEKQIMECVLASVLIAANEEIQERGWGRLVHESPLSETSAVFGVKPPMMHIHALNEPEVVQGLISLGLEQRMLGTHISQTAALDLAKASGAAIRPLNLISLEASSSPYFSLVA